MLNRRGARTEPCGTLNNAENGEENFPMTGTMESLFDK